MNIKHTIRRLLLERKQISKEDNRIKVSNPDIQKKINERYDDNTKNILALIKENFDILECDYITETLTYLGWAVNILYDDNGHFAIEDGGYQSISMKIADCELHFFVEKKQWKKTIREALKYYLKIK